MEKENFAYNGLCGKCWLTDKENNGGFKYLVLTGATLVCLLSGLTYITSIYLLPFEREFGISRVTAATSSSANFFFFALLCTFAGRLADYYGVTLVMSSGLVLVLIGLLITSWANGFAILIFFFGIFLGAGLAIAYMAALTIQPEYFPQRSGLAYGITLAGSGVGNFIFVWIGQETMNLFGWRTSLRILAAVFGGLSLIAIPLVQKKSKSIKEINAQDFKFEITNNKSTLPNNDAVFLPVGVDPLQNPIAIIVANPATDQFISTHDSTVASSSSLSINNCPAHFIPDSACGLDTNNENITYSAQNLCRDDLITLYPPFYNNVAKNNIVVESRVSKNTQATLETNICVYKTNMDNLNDQEIENKSCNEKLQKQLDEKIQEQSQEQLQKKIDKLQIGAPINKQLSVFDSTNSTLATELDEDKNQVQNENDKGKHKRTQTQKQTKNPIRKKKHAFFQWELLKNRILWWFMVSQAFVAFSYYPPYTHLVAYAEDNNLSSSEASTLLMFISVASLLARIGAGFACDRLGPIFVYKVSCSLLFVCCALWPVCTSKVALISLACGFGVANGAVVASTTSCCPILVGPEQASSALGLFYGIAWLPGSLATGPLMGWCKDETGSYTISISILAIFSFMSIITLTFPYNSVYTNSETAANINVTTTAGKISGDKVASGGKTR